MLSSHGRNLLRGANECCARPELWLRAADGQAQAGHTPDQALQSYDDLTRSFYKYKIV